MNENSIAAYAAMVSAIVAGLALYFSHKQNRSAELQVRLSLYDRRYKIFENYIKLLNTVVDRQSNCLDLYIVFCRENRQRLFLLKDEINRHIDSSRLKINALNSLFYEKPSEEDVARYLEWYDRKNKALDDILKLLDDAYIIFKEDLDFRNIS